MSTQPHLRARPGQVTHAGATGLQSLGFSSHRDSYLYVPSNYVPSTPAPLVLLLHGAGGHAHDGLAILRHLADDAGIILAAPASIVHSWDVIVRRHYGPDVDMVDRTLRHVFAEYAIDRSHLAIGGFSDGASYALSLGLANGDLFTHVMVFSPGFIAPLRAKGEPRIFISHGTGDMVLPIAPCSRSIVPQLRSTGYSLDYREFEGGHEIPPDIAQAAVHWLMADPATP